jgi:hypothetical protein
MNCNKIFFASFFKVCPGWGANPGIFLFHLFSHAVTLPPCHSGSPNCNKIVVVAKTFLNQSPLNSQQKN